MTANTSNLVLNHQDTKTQSSSLQPISKTINDIGKEVVDCAFQVHSHLGAGLLENIYEEAFACELSHRNIAFEKQKPLPINYKGTILKNAYRLDLIIENQIIVELKCVERIAPVHEAQLLTYLKLTGNRLGYIINFNVPIIKQGIKRIAL